MSGARVIRDTFDAWFASGGRIEGASVEGNLDAVAEFCARKAGHKVHFVVQQTDGRTATKVLHFYAVKRSSKRFTTRLARDGDYAVREGALEPALLFSMKVRAFEPVEPWRWAPGSDVVGREQGWTIQCR